MNQLIKTPVAAERLGIHYSHLISLIGYHKIAAPPKDTSGDYVWSEADLTAAREALRTGRSRRQKP
jgi:hypothetical protein